MAKAPTKPKVVDPVAPAAVISKRGLFELVNEDARIIEEELDKLQAGGMSYEEAIEKAVEATDKMTAKKVLSYGALILALEAEAEMIAAVAKRTAARAAVKTNKAKWLRIRLLNLLPRDFTAENEHLKLSFRNNGFSVADSTVGDVKALPEALRRHQPEAWTVNKDAAYDHLMKIIEQAKTAAISLGAAAPESEVETFIKKYVEENTKDLQGMHLVQGWSVSIK